MSSTKLNKKIWFIFWLLMGLGYFSVMTPEDISGAINHRSVLVGSILLVVIIFNMVSLLADVFDFDRYFIFIATFIAVTLLFMASVGILNWLTLATIIMLEILGAFYYRRRFSNRVLIKPQA